MVRRWICGVFVVLAAGCMAPLGAQSAFPFGRDLVLDARPLRGGKRVPILSIDASGEAQIDLWCKRGSGQAVIAGETITIIVGNMAEEPCTPERTQADAQLIAALSQVTSWSYRGDVVTFDGGGATLRFRAVAN